MSLVHVVYAGNVASLEEIEGDLYADVRVARLAPRHLVPPCQNPSALVEENTGHLGHRVVHHLDPELVAPVLELEVPDARAREGEDGDGDRCRASCTSIGVGVEAELGEVVAEEEREGAPHAVASERDAHLLALVLGHEAGDLREELVAAASGGELSGGVSERNPDSTLTSGRGSVGSKRAGASVLMKLASHSDPVTVPRKETRMSRRPRRAASLSEATATYPIHRLFLLLLLLLLLHDPMGNVTVDVLGDRVLGAVGYSDRLQHLALAVLAVEVALGAWVKVERTVAHGHELAVTDDLGAQERVELRAHKASPVVGALDLPPHARQRRWRGHHRLGTATACYYLLRLRHRRGRRWRRSG
nr:unnamed protein product [Digitaria exilis]